MAEGVSKGTVSRNKCSRESNIGSEDDNGGDDNDNDNDNDNEIAIKGVLTPNIEVSWKKCEDGKHKPVEFDRPIGEDVNDYVKKMVCVMTIFFTIS